jgi:drug/metabolite transporter (DMT)-like permease
MTTTPGRSAPPAPALGIGAVVVITMLCLSWAFNQVAVKVALPEIPPLMQATVRSLGATLVVALAARLRGVPWFVRDGTLRLGLACGVLFGFEFVMIYSGLVWTTASRAVVFLYTAPFFVVLGARLWLGERLTVSQWSGLALSFFGVVLAIGVPQVDVDATVLLGDVLLLLAGGGWAAATLLVKATSLARIAAERTLAYQLVVSVPVLALASWLFGESWNVTPGALALTSLAYQTFWVVGVTFLIWFQMVKTYSPSRLSAFTFMTPLFGVIAGYLVMGDPVTPVFAFAVVLVLAGLVLINRPR